MAMVKIGDNFLNLDRILWVNVGEEAALIIIEGDEQIRVPRSDEATWNRLMRFLDNATAWSVILE